MTVPFDGSLGYETLKATRMPCSVVPARCSVLNLPIKVNTLAQRSACKSNEGFLRRNDKLTPISGDPDHLFKRDHAIILRGNIQFKRKYVILLNFSFGGVAIPFPRSEE